MKGVIFVEDYLFEGNKIYGVKDDEGWILDDGDVYSIRDLLNEGYKVSAITPLQIEEKGKSLAQQENALEWRDFFNECGVMENIGINRKKLIIDKCKAKDNLKIVNERAKRR
jgi:hypothetical protein